ncbi:hypothetical protein [Evansella cellulosilytica]|uniref:Uncharacterized protein n=1 Tax=Evansella cellulosilytica (strain ATCC 21833 / DSM 2522 / FERM P-1141 / JCM 9156 / N-4) TaxID=649639 RepID=E6TWK1_EVAC2|nr:hypothetical protein [Evansella cellulosilytica]ADU32264.1 hypothetical protein Bcell_4033 [Evansella cellulosilytica DSM 2522]
MREEEIKGLKREMNKEIERVKRAHKSFKKRVSIVANIFIPGLGLIVYGGSVIAALITMVLFYSYICFYLSVIFVPIDAALAVIYFVPAVVIWIVSLIMVVGMDDL